MTEQPDHLDIAVGLGFQAAAGAGTVQITVDVELQQISRRVARTTRRLRHRADKPKRREVQPVDKCLDEPHRIVSSDVIVNRLRQEEQLRTIVTGKVCHAGFVAPQRTLESLTSGFHTDFCVGRAWTEYQRLTSCKNRMRNGNTMKILHRIFAITATCLLLTGIATDTLAWNNSRTSAKISALPVQIKTVQSSTLSWISTNVKSCTGVNFWTGGLTSGTVIVAPSETTTYSITCTGKAESANASVTVQVGSSSMSFYDDFSSYVANVCMPDGTVFGPWVTAYAG